MVIIKLQCRKSMPKVRAEHVVDASDVVNGDEVADHKYKPTEIIHCIDSENFVSGNRPQDQLR